MIYYGKTLFGCGPKLTAVHLITPNPSLHGSFSDSLIKVIQLKLFFEPSNTVQKIRQLLICKLLCFAQSILRNSA